MYRYRNQVRHIVTSTSRLRQAQDITKIPLSTPLPSSQTLKLKDVKSYVKPFDTTISKLDSGVRVASELHYGDYCTIGLAIESGARFEAGYPFGTSHLMEKLAFGSTSRHSSRDEIYSVLEANGGIIDCQSTKDTFIFAASCHVKGMDAVMEVLANAIWRPRITDEELDEAKRIVQYENLDMSRKIESEPLITDWLHKAAFRDNTLGFSKFCDEQILPSITREHVFSYISQYHAPERLVVAGVGVDHEQLLESARTHFNPSTSTWATDPKVLLNKLPKVDKSIAQYTGGEVRKNCDLSLLAVGTPYPHLAHVALGFEGVSYRDKDFVVFCVLQSLLGGGGSFSAGGPGKGMYTRLYTDVMNRHYWIYGATAFNHSYADAGLFCIQASSDPDQLNQMLRVLLDQFLKLSKGVQKEELDRAKIQLQSQLMMNLEVRPVMFEDLSRQVIGHGYRRKPDEYMAEIDAVQSTDIVRVADRMLSGRPSLVGYGVLKGLQSYEALDEAVAQRSLQPLDGKQKIFSWQ